MAAKSKKIIPTSEGWLTGKVYAGLRRDRAAAFMSADQRAIAGVLFPSAGNGALHGVSVSECVTTSGKVLETEFADLSKYLAPLATIRERLAIADAHAADAHGAFIHLWQSTAHATSGMSLRQSDKDKLAALIEPHVLRVADVEPPKHSGSLIAYRTQLLADQVSLSGNRVDAVAAAANVHAGKLHDWYCGALNLNAREKCRLGMLTGMEPEKFY